MQPADSALRLNVHFHTLALDGVYVRDEEGELQFRELDEPTAGDVAQVAAWTHASLLRVIKRHGRSLAGVSDAADSFATDQPVLASCYGASAADVQLLGPAASRKTAKLVCPLRLVQQTGARALAEVGSPAVGPKYEYFSLFFLKVWTWEGDVVIYEEGEDSYIEVTPEELREYTGRSSDEFGRPFLYRFPLGQLALLGGLLAFVLTVVRRMRET